MSKLLIKPQINPRAENGRVTHVTPENAGWNHIGFDVYRLKAGEEMQELPEGREVCLVFLTGKGRVFCEEKDYGVLGKRTSVFEGLPAAFYVPPQAQYKVVAETDLELAVCSAKAKGGLYAPHIIAEGDLSQETRGKGSNVRHVTNILAETDEAEALLVVEVITPNGNTSSYPPHKHDQNNLPHETALEETYYHRINPPQGFAFQRVYTDDRSLDEAMAVEDGDVTLVPRGYHPCATCHGYDLYYLNVMAGPLRQWKFHNAKEHEWLLKQ